MVSSVVFVWSPEYGRVRNSRCLFKHWSLVEAPSYYSTDERRRSTDRTPDRYYSNSSSVGNTIYNSSRVCSMRNRWCSTSFIHTAMLGVRCHAQMVCGIFLQCPFQFPISSYNRILGVIDRGTRELSRLRKITRKCSIPYMKMRACATLSFHAQSP